MCDLLLSKKDVFFVNKWRAPLFPTKNNQHKGEESLWVVILDLLKSMEVLLLTWGQNFTPGISSELFQFVCVFQFPSPQWKDTDALLFYSADSFRGNKVGDVHKCLFASILLPLPTGLLLAPREHNSHRNCASRDSFCYGCHQNRSWSRVCNRERETIVNEDSLKIYKLLPITLALPCPALPHPSPFLSGPGRGVVKHLGQGNMLPVKLLLSVGTGSLPGIWHEGDRISSLEKIYLEGEWG